MIALVLLLLAAPKTDGVYVEEASFTLLNAPAVSEDELALIEFARFTKTQLTVQYVLEADTHRWRGKSPGLEVQGTGDEWAARVWREHPGDVVETDVMHPGSVERLRFVTGTLEERKKLAARAFTTAQLTRLAGGYGEGKEVQKIDASSKLTASQCFPSCTTFASVCLGSKKLLLLETEEGLLRLPGVEGLCGSYRTGVEARNGVLLERTTPAAPVPEGKVDTKHLLAAIEARVGSCNPTKSPRHVKLTLTLGRSGFVTGLDAGDAQLTACLGEALARLTFPTQRASTTLTVEWDLPAAH